MSKIQEMPSGDIKPSTAMLREEPSSAAIVRRDLRIIIPAHNEAERLNETVGELWEYFGARATLLVVANGCTDDTTEVVRRLARRYPTVELLDIPNKIGKGGAVRAGLTLGTEPYVAFVDADGSTAADQLDVLLKTCIARGLSGMIGSRWLPGSRIAPRQPLRRRLASRIFNRIVRVVFGLELTDTQCGAKVFDRKAIDQILGDLEISNFAFDVDLLLSLRKIGKPFSEMPIAWRDVAEYSKIRLVRSAPPMLWALLRLFIRESVFRQLPFFNWLGRSETIPVRFGLDILFLLPKRQAQSATYLELFRLLKERGHTARVMRLDDAFSLPAFAFWYVREGHLLSNVIVNGFGKRLTGLLSYSAKPKLSLDGLTTVEDPAIFCDRFILAIVAAMNGSLHFRREGDGWNLAAQRLEAAPREH
jgi:dolichol-phosphate mannosyltransferase